MAAAAWETAAFARPGGGGMHHRTSSLGGNYEPPARRQAAGGGSPYPRAAMLAAAAAPQEAPEDYTWLYGWILLAVTYVGFVLAMYAMLASKWMPQTGIAWLDWIAQDRYYAYLVPATLPVTFYMVVWNWMSMKFFRHN